MKLISTNIFFFFSKVPHFVASSAVEGDSFVVQQLHSDTPSPLKRNLFLKSFSSV